MTGSQRHINLQLCVTEESRFVIRNLTFSISIRSNAAAADLCQLSQSGEAAFDAKTAFQPAGTR